MKTYSFTLQGRREYQQDRYGVNDTMAVIADGMGGHANGELAAQAVVTRAFACGVNPDILTMCNALKLADKDCTDSGDNRGSTAIIVSVHKNKAQWVHAGDSRLMYVKPSQKTAEFLTEDHGRGHILFNAVGFLEKMDHGTLIAEPGDLLVLTTDGVHDYLSEMVEIILSAIENKQNPAQVLCETAFEKGSRDNCTAIVMEF